MHRYIAPKLAIVLLAWHIATIQASEAYAMAADDAETSLRNRLLQSAVRIRSERIDGDAIVTGHGTAFALDMAKWGFPGPRYLLSAAHNVLDESNHLIAKIKIELRFTSSQSWSSCRVVAYDRDLDLCLLEAAAPVAVQSTLAAVEVEAGQQVLLAGSPRGTPLALYTGILIKRVAGDTSRASAQLPFDHGCSGGPFFNAKGEVIGVAVAGVAKDGDMDKNCGLFVAWGSVMRFLDRIRADMAHD